MLLKALKSVDIAVLEGKRCKDRCLECFSKEDISRMREVLWTKTWTENRVEWFYDKLSEGRSKNKKTYFPTIGGNDVCSVCFRLLYYINKNFYFKHRKKFSEGCRSAGMKNLRKIGRGRDAAILWLNDYVCCHADQMPDSPIRLLPYKYRKAMVYDSSVEDMMDKEENVISFSSFRNLWNEEFPYLKIKQVSYM